MPELPEVETIVNQLRKKILHKKISKVEILDALIDSHIPKLVPFQIDDIYRRAKYIIMKLDKEQFLLVHLGMTGQFYVIKEAELDSSPAKNYLLAKFWFGDGLIMTHNSVRKIGSFKLLTKEQLDTVLSKLGPEPLEAEFTLNKFKQMLSTKSRAVVKTTLMDQHFISGIGNIYAQEALYHAGISPLRKIGTLSAAEQEKLFKSIQYVLKEGIKHKGTSVDDYVHVEGKGGFQDLLAVYLRKKCPHGHAIIKLDMGGRGTSYCPQCQK